MSGSPPVTLPRAVEPQAAQGEVRAEQPQTFPPSGSDSSSEIGQARTETTAPARGHDEVKLQWVPPGETPVYRFVNQEGAVILQVPSEQMLNLGREISQQLADEAAPKEAAAVEGTKDNGH
jgi:hypothetical protein